MKPLFTAALAGTALLAGGVLVASEFGRTPGASAIAQNAPALPASPIQTAEAKNAALKTVTLKIDNMFCVSCPIIVRRTLERVDGVREVQVSFQSKTAIVSYDPARCDVARLTAATAETGFPSTIIQ